MNARIVDPDKFDQEKPETMFGTTIFLGTIPANMVTMPHLSIPQDFKRLTIHFSELFRYEMVENQPRSAIKVIRLTPSGAEILLERADPLYPRNAKNEIDWE